VQNYIGMIFDFSNDKEVVIEMKSFIDELLKYAETVGEALTAADRNLFDTTYDSLD